MLTDELTRRAERTIRERSLFAHGERIVVGVSGGADSVALLHMLCELRERYDYRVAAAHVNHGLRGDESDAEEAYIRALCERLGTPCFATRVDVAGALAAHGNNLQSAARALRFEAFRAAAVDWGAGATALGHHADDQAETVLMRLLRGAGAGGLGGIRFVAEVNGLKLVRPLLRIKKTELEAYCERHGLAPRFDSSNAKRTYFRNAIRLDLLPYIMKLRPGAADSLRRAAELSADEDELLDALASERVREATKREGGAIRAERTAFLEAHIALQRRMIKIILNSLKLDENAIDFAKVERIREAIAASLPTTLEIRTSADTAFRRSYDALEWGPYRREAPKPYRRSFDPAGAEAGEVELPAVGGWIEWRSAEIDRFRPPEAADAFEAWFDADRAPTPWTVRTRAPGDRMDVFGLNGSKSVKDIFVDGKLPKARRDVWPVVTDADGTLLWVPGFRRAAAAPVGHGTKRVVAMRLRFEGNFFD
ncbi:tRNA lysidine(34) synthetase TilS [Paenibacillus sp.]|uniref:tRNA lysidine(34) synthetase TilS n=1 Tax=Paenibacillus sp. TaxID=58172 RepID=UPI0028114C8E|nr:tRNA lysidine(34) synthetase TilS [Paenibacillus sp.]